MKNINEKPKEGRGGTTTFRDQVEKILFGMELKRYRAEETLRDILEVIEKNQLSLDHPTIQKHLRMLFVEISFSDIAKNDSVITLELLEEAFQKLEDFIADYHTALKRLGQNLKSNSLERH